MFVAGCHGHHGQLPAGEYLVTTSAHTTSSSGQPSFLPWQDFLNVCLEWNLPLNDTWIIPGRTAAAEARELLDHLALSGCTTAQALQQLNALVYQQGSSNPGLGGSNIVNAGIHLPGTYPHDEWQGTRLEGFVISQGQEGLSRPEAWQGLRDVRDKMARQVLNVTSLDESLRKPYEQLLQKSGEKKISWHL